jgi:hypothetical protein
MVHRETLLYGGYDVENVRNCIAIHSVDDVDDCDDSFLIILRALYRHSRIQVIFMTSV